MKTSLSITLSVDTVLALREKSLEEKRSVSSILQEGATFILESDDSRMVSPKLRTPKGKRIINNTGKARRKVKSKV